MEEVMKRWPILVGLLVLGFAVHAARPVTTNSESPVADTARATEPQASDDQHKTPASKMPVVHITVGPRPSAKPVWEWSDEERIRVRFDPASIRERAAANAAHNAAVRATQPSAHAQAQSAEESGSSQH